MERIRQANLKLSPEKCLFFQRRSKFVGHTVSKAGKDVYPDKTDQVTSWPTPPSPEGVRRFLGFVGYNRRINKHLSQISRPLTELMLVSTAEKTKVNSKKKKKDWRRGENLEKPFATLKQLLTSTAYLGYAD